MFCWDIKKLIKPIKPTKPYIQSEPKPPEKYVIYFREKEFPTKWVDGSETIEVSVINDLAKKYNFTNIYIETDDYSNGYYVKFRYQEKEELSKEVYDRNYNNYLFKLKSYERKKRNLLVELQKYEEELQKYEEDLKTYEAKILEFERIELENKLNELKQKLNKTTW